MTEYQRVVGVDPSLTSTGICLINRIDQDPLYAPRAGTDFVASAHLVKSKPGADRTYRGMSLRISAIVEEICTSFDTDPAPGLVVLEGPSYGSTSPSTHARSWLWGNIYDSCVARGLPVLVATPSQVKKYATGRGNADKDTVLAATIRRWPAVDITGNDTADALVLAAIGCRYLGVPIDAIPQDHWKQVMTKLVA